MKLKLVNVIIEGGNVFLLNLKGNEKTVKLIKNTGIFAVANILSKIVMLAIIPFFTYYLNSIEYGLIDSITTTVNLLLPLCSISIYEAVLRFGMIKSIDNRKVITNSLILVITSTLILIMFYPIIYMNSVIKNYYWLFCIILTLEELISIFNSFSKTVNKIALCATLSVVRTGIFIITSCLFVMVLQKGIYGYLYSIIISILIPILLYLFKYKFYKYIRLKFDKALLKEMIKYSLPLTVNGMMWWIMASSDKYIIIYFLGLSANGLYSVANKVPSIINMLHSTFFQAWQLTAIEEFNSEQASNYYSRIFNKYAKIAFLVSMLTIILVKPLLEFTLAPEYRITWKYAIFLIIASLFSSFSSFYGASYSASGKTQGALMSSIIGATANLLLNILIIPLLGIQGAAISTFFSYLLMWIVRVFDTKKFIHIKIEISSFLLNTSITILMALFLLIEQRYSFILALFLCVIGIIINIYLILYQKDHKT